MLAGYHMLEHLGKIIRWIMRDVPFLGAYPARVAAQWPDGTFDLTVDDPRLRARGLQRVTARYGLPETGASIEIGTPCLLEFDGGDPTAPRVTAWGYQENSAVLRIGSDPRPVARHGDLVGFSLGSIKFIAGSKAVTDGETATVPPWTKELPTLPVVVTVKGITSSGFGRIVASQTKVTA
jgi:hypothetical protein